MEVMEVPKRIRRLSDAIKNELRIKHPPPRTYGPTESFFEDDTGRGRLKAKSPKQPIHRRPSYHGQHISKESIHYPDIHLRDDSAVKLIYAAASPIGRDLRYGFEGSARRPADPPRAPSRMDKVLPPTPPSSSSTSARNSPSPPRAPGGPPHLYASTTDPSRQTRAILLESMVCHIQHWPPRLVPPDQARAVRSPGTGLLLASADFHDTNTAPIISCSHESVRGRAPFAPTRASGGTRAVPQLDAVRRASTQPHHAPKRCPYQS
ncbi:hypothetical protein A0H81_11938 [Grifola frondosa]|uniref:Uncharacterized protein n=1 Tax=Grifola frondosa TaxID=5627 RepID=A0A1C7LU87_GRIFR|nr:hypothetical protein A0H81_11938 [Grifola frondosa]